MGTIRKGEMKMKSKFMILFASVLAVSTIGLAGCASDGNATSSTDINSAAVSETANILNTSFRRTTTDFR